MNFCGRIFLAWYENGDILEMNFWLVKDMNAYFFIDVIIYYLFFIDVIIRSLSKMRV